MKVYISADMEGIAGVAHWEEVEATKPDYDMFRKQMTAEVGAACKGALKAGATELLVKDAHDAARNFLLEELPKEARVIRGWSNHPLSMVEELNSSFAAAMMIGYHSAAGTASSPLAHTLMLKINEIRINGIRASEFLIHAYAASQLGVPVVFVSGDEGICEEVTQCNPHITTVAVKKGIGGSVVCLHPKVVCKKIKEGVESALSGDYKQCLLPLPDKFTVEINYRNHVDAMRASFYPGMKATAATVVSFETTDYFEVMRSLLFTCL